MPNLITGDDADFATSLGDWIPIPAASIPGLIGTTTGFERDCTTTYTTLLGNPVMQIVPTYSAFETDIIFGVEAHLSSPISLPSGPTIAGYNLDSLVATGNLVPGSGTIALYGSVGSQPPVLGQVFSTVFTSDPFHYPWDHLALNALTSILPTAMAFPETVTDLYIMFWVKATGGLIPNVFGNQVVEDIEANHLDSYAPSSGGGGASTLHWGGVA